MQQYMVMAIYEADDFPVFLTSDREEAFRFALDTEAAPAWLLEQSGADRRGFVAMRVVEFQDGFPVRVAPASAGIPV